MNSHLQGAESYWKGLIGASGEDEAPARDAEPARA
jgi:hypothetical protein